jgi:hypothetical protein
VGDEVEIRWAKLPAASGGAGVDKVHIPRYSPAPALPWSVHGAWDVGHAWYARVDACSGGVAERKKLPGRATTRRRPTRGSQPCPSVRALRKLFVVLLPLLLSRDTTNGLGCHGQDRGCLSHSFIHSFIHPSIHPSAWCLRLPLYFFSLLAGWLASGCLRGATARPRIHVACLRWLSLRIHMHAGTPLNSTE